MPNLKIGLDLTALRQPFRQALLTAARLGVDAVEIDGRGELSPRRLTQTALRQVRKLLDDANMRVAAVRFRTRRGYADPEDLDRRIEATKAAMSLAYRLGAGAVVNRVGPVPGDRQSSSWSQLLDALAEVGRHGLQAGASLAAETGPDGGEELAALVDALPEGSLGIDFNPGRLILHEHSPDEALQALARHVLHVHATDAVQDVAAHRADPTPLGQGAADVPNLLARLHESGYRGYFTLQPPTGGAAQRWLTEAVRYLRSF